MPPHSDPKRKAQQLRQQAERILARTPRERTTDDNNNTQRQLVHELQVYQVELELQNEELRRSQAELQAASDSYALLYDYAPLGYVTLDARGIVVQANLTASTMLAINRSKLLGTPLPRFIAAADQDTFYFHRHRVFETRIKQSCELQIQALDGTVFTGYLESCMMPERPGQELHCLTTLSDTTSLKQAEATLREAEEHFAALGMFAAGIAHELNNPLGAMAVTAEHARTILATPESLDEVDDCLSDILGDVLRCTQIVKSVFDFARRGRSPKAHVDLHALIRSASAFIQRYAEQHGVRLVLALTPTPIRLFASAEDVELLLVNLVSNAIEASPPHARVTIRTAVEAQQVRIMVEDTGHGLSPEDLSRAFEPFYRGCQSRGRSGFGLTIARRVVLDHDGTIRLQSTTGHGATAHVCLPLSPSTAPAHA